MTETSELLVLEGSLMMDRVQFLTTWTCHDNFNVFPEKKILPIF